VYPAAALADVGGLEPQSAREEPLEAARGEVRRAAGEDEAAVPFRPRLHELEHLCLTRAAAPVAAADDVGMEARVPLETVEVDVREGAGAFAQEHERAGHVS